LGLPFIADEKGMVIRIGGLGVKIAKGEDMPSSRKKDAHLMEQGFLALLHAPIVQTIAGHPKEEILIAPVLPGMEATQEEGRFLANVQLGKAIPGPSRHLLVRLPWGIPPHAETMEEIVDAVERAHSATTGDEKSAPALQRSRLEEVAFRAQALKVRPPDSQEGSEGAGCLVGGRAPDEDQVSRRRCFVIVEERELLAGHLLQIPLELASGEGFGANRIVGNIEIPPVDPPFA